MSDGRNGEADANSFVKWMPLLMHGGAESTLKVPLDSRSVTDRLEGGRVSSGALRGQRGTPEAPTLGNTEAASCTVYVGGSPEEKSQELLSSILKGCFSVPKKSQFQDWMFRVLRRTKFCVGTFPLL